MSREILFQKRVISRRPIAKAVSKQGLFKLHRSEPELISRELRSSEAHFPRTLRRPAKMQSDIGYN